MQRYMGHGVTKNIWFVDGNRDFGKRRSCRFIFWPSFFLLLLQVERTSLSKFKEKVTYFATRVLTYFKRQSFEILFTSVCPLLMPRLSKRPMITVLARRLNEAGSEDEILSYYLHYCLVLDWLHYARRRFGPSKCILRVAV